MAHKGRNHPTPGKPDKPDTNHTIERMSIDCSTNQKLINRRAQAMTHPLPTHPPPHHDDMRWFESCHKY